MGISGSDIELLSGHKNARKVLLVKGVKSDKAISILKSILKSVLKSMTNLKSDRWTSMSEPNWSW